MHATTISFCRRNRGVAKTVGCQQAIHRTYAHLPTGAHLLVDNLTAGEKVTLSTGWWRSVDNETRKSYPQTRTILLVAIDGADGNSYEQKGETVGNYHRRQQLTGRHRPVDR
jgi:hypothetical protein